MYKIGEFAKLTNLSVRTLRYYNDLGLLIPEEVDVMTNYRYYGNRNLEEVKIITLLKEVGFTLEEIQENWDQFNDELFKKQKQKLYEKITGIEDSIKQLDYLRRNTKNGKIILSHSEEKKIKKLGGKY